SSDHEDDRAEHRTPCTGDRGDDRGIRSEGHGRYCYGALDGRGEAEPEVGRAAPDHANTPSTAASTATRSVSRWPSQLVGAGGGTLVMGRVVRSRSSVSRAT